MEVIRSLPENAAALTELLYNSRSVWDYPEDYANASKPLLRITPSFIEENTVYQLIESGQTIAFYSFTAAEFGRELNNFWVARGQQGKGFGTVLWRDAIKVARENNWDPFFILPDPGAESFYLRMGATRTGEILASRLPSGPRFQKLIFRIS
ncbi:MAG: GNAT family N-acetyltransferase [Proteobacteria bacterium]|nr:MAG: GNAT family N-acetyltransferase [Pseudomonadota bacterium]